MINPDHINASFQAVSALLLITNVVKLYKDKKLSGVNILPTAFFAIWGIWNLFYYPMLNQWYSFIAGLLVVSVNTLWVSMAIYYKKHQKLPWKMALYNRFIKEFKSKDVNV